MNGAVPNGNWKINEDFFEDNENIIIIIENKVSRTIKWNRMINWLMSDKSNWLI